MTDTLPNIHERHNASDAGLRSAQARFSALELQSHFARVREETRARTKEMQRQRDAMQETLSELVRLRQACTEAIAPRHTARRVPVPKGRTGRGTGQEVSRLASLHATYAESRDPRLRAELVEAYDAFACSIGRTFSTRRESREDLVQVARLGLVVALDRFDPHLGRPFKTFARSTITGELKRHLRDRTWRVHVARSAQDHFLVVARAVDDLTQTLGRSPRIPEVAAHTGLNQEQVLEAMEVGDRQHPASLDAPAAPGTPARSEPATTEAGFEGVEHSELVSSLMSRLSPTERELLRLRFVEQLNQADIARRMGGNQMSVSRALARTLGRMRALAGDPG